MFSLCVYFYEYLFKVDALWTNSVSWDHAYLMFVILVEERKRSIVFYSLWNCYLDCVPLILLQRIKQYDFNLMLYMWPRKCYHIVLYAIHFCVALLHLHHLCFFYWKTSRETPEPQRCGTQDSNPGQEHSGQWPLALCREPLRICIIFFGIHIDCCVGAHHAGIVVQDEKFQRSCIQPTIFVGTVYMHCIESYAFNIVYK